MSTLELVMISAIFAMAADACHPRSHQFKNNTDLVNWIYPDHLLFQSTQLSGLGCARQCSNTPSCVSFTYPGSLNTPGTCRGHSTRDFSVSNAEPSDGVSTFLMTEAINVALHKPVAQSSTAERNATLATDGSFNTNTISRLHSCAHTEEPDAGERNWWQVDLEACYSIWSVTITTRADCCAERLHDFDVDVYDKDPAIYPDVAAQRCHHYVGQIPSGATEKLVCENWPIVGRVVRVTNAPDEILTLCEVQVMATP